MVSTFRLTVEEPPHYNFIKMEKIKNYINGKLIAPNSGDYLENFNPSTGKVYCLLPNSNKKDFTLALSSAKKAFLFWSQKSKKYRYYKGNDAWWFRNWMSKNKHSQSFK